MDFANLNLEKFNEIAKQILLLAMERAVESKREFEKLRNSVVKAEKSEVFHNLYFIKAYQDLVNDGIIDENPLILSFIKKRSVRTLSGVAPVTVLTKPYFCPGKCVYCPTDLRMPKSYLPSQPAAQRAFRQSFNPYTQVFVRLKALHMAGHDTSKIELRIIGGSFNAYPRAYQKWFVKRCLLAMNEFSVLIKDEKAFSHKNVVKKSIYGDDLVSEIRVKSLSKTSRFEEEVLKNEKSLCKCIGINVETRPDLISVKELKFFRTLGVTKVEMGVQTLFDEIQLKTDRGHDTKAVSKAFSLLKDFGFKIGVHMMPNLPYSTPEMDKQMMKDLFNDERFKPDYLKIYPCVVVKRARLSKLYEKGEFTPYTDDVLLDILSDNLKNVPFFCRVDRIARDIPANDVQSGLKTSNIRQILEEKLVKEGFKIQEIRFREIKNEKVDENSINFILREYSASNGKEFFLSFEDVSIDKLIALLRLRLPGKVHIKDLEGAMIIREVHVYGTQIPVGKKSGEKQHQGFGSRLIVEAEKICINNGFKRLAIIAGIGTREYYAKRGYQLRGTYMVKDLF
ncbi:MAG: tRNA uridine(34) 5-carboxymethylaminomethyl modification radical SAM/GNAT enzyme Elp3 [Candidatus Gracilibacteria bacterium]|jgi:elongator complex protein 3|nr:tRNA uridine(34) 5-carboxymethylaminomethyl modification radical SAM/GNAT enzyme Elp3 [Candidatus Gracilibacteria bacterium]